MRHAPYFCEENVWHLAHDSAVRVGGASLTSLPRRALFVTNAARLVPTFAQRAGDPVLWDYHVILAVHGPAGWRALDLDTTLGWDVPLASWLAGSFPDGAVPPHLLPMFRVVDARALAATFASDRSHMRDQAGAPRQPFPPWPPISCPLGPMTLPRYLDLDDPIAGSWMTLEGLRARLAAAPSEGL